MDINSLKINLGLLEQSIERAKKNKTVYRGSVEHVITLVEEGREELAEFIKDVDRVLAETQDRCL